MAPGLHSEKQTQHAHLQNSGAVVYLVYIPLVRQFNLYVAVRSHSFSKLFSACILSGPLHVPSSELISFRLLVKLLCWKPATTGESQDCVVSSFLSSFWASSNRRLSLFLFGS